MTKSGAGSLVVVMERLNRMHESGKLKGLAYVAFGGDGLIDMVVNGAIDPFKMQAAVKIMEQHNLDVLMKKCRKGK